jgi:ComF family protein
MGRVFDLLFPLECLACGAPGAHCCPSCLAGVRLGRRVFRGRALGSVFAAHPYADPLARTLLHHLKYEGWTCAWPAIETLTRRAAAALPALSEGALIVPVPLHRRKEAVRGFNQAAMIAETLAETLGADLRGGALVRVRPTRPQSEEGIDRSANTAGAFVADGCVGGRPVLLVDDVRTSGATMEACARALRRAGAARVDGFALVWGGGRDDKEA